MSFTRLLLSQVMLGIGFFGLFMSIYWGLTQPSRRWFAVAPGSWFLHMVIYYLFVVVFNPVVSELNAIWSLVVRYHATFLILGGMLIFMLRIDNGERSNAH